MQVKTEITYQKDTSDRLWWCNSHRREATYTRTTLGGGLVHCCDPKLGGILLPCSCVDLTDEIEFYD